MFLNFLASLIAIQTGSLYVNLSLSRWEAYEQARDILSAWLSEQDMTLRRDPEPHSTLLDMEQLHAQYQVLHENIVAHQSDLDDLTARGQELLDTNSDARVSHSITQLTTKYQTLETQSKVV